MTKRIALTIGGGVLVVIAAVVGLFVTQLDRIVADSVEAYGHATTGTNVSVRSADIALTDSKGELKGLTIGNPNGFETDYALRIDDIQLAFDLGSLRSDVPIVREVLVDDAHVNAEQRGDATNLSAIQSHMGEAARDSASPTEHEAPGRIIIDRFRLTNARVTLTSDLLSEPEDLDLENVVVEGIGRGSGGATYEEATAAVLNPILAAARSAVQTRLRDAAAGAAREKIEEKAGERLRDLLDR